MTNMQALLALMAGDRIYAMNKSDWPNKFIYFDQAQDAILNEIGAYAVFDHQNSWHVYPIGTRLKPEDVGRRCRLNNQIQRVIDAYIPFGDSYVIGGQTYDRWGTVDDTNFVCQVFRP